MLLKYLIIIIIQASTNCKFILRMLRMEKTFTRMAPECLVTMKIVM